MPSPSRVRRLIVSVDDLARATAFYRSTLGLEPTGAAGDLAFLRAADGVELLLHRRPVVASDTAVAAGFVVEDADAAVARCLGSGGTVVDPVTAQPWGERMATVRDPDGHLLCISEVADVRA